MKITNPSMKITNTSVKKLPPPESGYKIIYDSDLSGFGIRITSSGYKSFIAESRVNGKTRRATIAKFGTKTADEARKEAKKLLGQMASGTDPTAEKRQRKAESVTLAEVADDYKANRRTSKGLPLKDSTKADIDKHLQSTFKDWRTKPVSTITREQVKKHYAMRCKRSVAQANQAMRILRALVNYAAASYRTPDGERIIRDNPVAVLRESSMLREVKPRQNKVKLEELGKWWSAVQAMRADPALTTASRSAADLLAVLALTGLRIGEGRALRREHVDLDEGTLVLLDTKNRTERLTLPLSSLAVDILEGRPDGEWLFPARSGPGHLVDCRGQLEALEDKTGIRVTAHDLRRTFRAVAAKCEIELWRTKALMGHKQEQDVTLKHYANLEDVRYLRPEVDAIADYFEVQRRIHEGENVVHISSRSRA